MRTGFIALRLALAGFIVPYVFAFNEGLLGINTNFVNTILLILTTMIGVVCLGSSFEGYFITHSRWYERVFLGITAFLMIDPDFYTDMIGVFLLVIVFLLQSFRKKRNSLST